MQAAWGLLLGRYLGGDEVSWGVISSGRPPELADVEGMVGPFNNLLPLQVRIDRSAPLVGWLRDLQGRLADLREHEQSSFVDVRRWTGAPDDRPLFGSYVVYENFPLPPTFLEGCRRGEASSATS
jgi:non-ribosomal peptide synthetase component F